MRAAIRGPAGSVATGERTTGGTVEFVEAGSRTPDVVGDARVGGTAACSAVAVGWGIACGGSATLDAIGARGLRKFGCARHRAQSARPTRSSFHPGPIPPGNEERIALRSPSFHHRKNRHRYALHRSMPEELSLALKPELGRQGDRTGLAG